MTGGAGFIGSNLTETLLAAGHRVRVLDNFLTGKRENLEGLAEAHGDAFELVEGDLRDLETVRRAIEGIEYVLHQGALPSVPRSVPDPVLSNEINVAGTVNVPVAARDAGVRRVVFAASSSAYGDTPELPKRESMTPNPKSPYAAQKLTGEHYMRIFHEVYGLETVSLRYFNVFGPRQDPKSTPASSDSSTVVKRSCASASCSLIRLGSVMSAMADIQPSCSPSSASSGEMYMRASNSVPSLRCNFSSKPLGEALPASVSESWVWCSAYCPGGQYGKGAPRPTSSCSDPPVIWQNAGFTWRITPSRSITSMPVASESSMARRNAVSARNARSTRAWRTSRRASAISVPITASDRPPTSHARALPSSGERCLNADASIASRRAAAGSEPRSAAHRAASAPWRRGIWVDWHAAGQEAATVLSRHGIVAPGPHVPARMLSGGNQQKLVLARALRARPSVLVAENPARGLGLRAAAAIQVALREAAGSGVAVLVYSTDLDAVLALGCSRLLVMLRGEIT